MNPVRLPLVLVALACALLPPPGSEARACIYLPLTRIGPPPSARELAEERVSHERALRRQRRERAAAALAAGAEPAAVLAEMLVPNIRPIRIDRSDCGPTNEIDPGEGEETPELLLAGTRFADRAGEFADMFWRRDWETLGPACNAEFRGRFAAHLRRRLTPAELREGYLFLGSYWDLPGGPDGLRWRLTTFEARTRRPPLRWNADSRMQNREIARWTRLVPAGRAMKRTIDTFWQETEPLLGDAALACPGAAARWPEQQARIVAAIQARIDDQRAHMRQGRR